MISREDLVEQSVSDRVRQAIFVERGYSADDVEMIESFPALTADQALPKNYIALGFDFDDGGEPAEMGSDLLRRVYTIEFFVFGQTRTWAKNLANHIKFALENEDTLPLMDIGQTPPVEIDQLLVVSSHTARQPIPDPEPWQEFVWTTHVRVEDCYHAGLV